MITHDGIQQGSQEWLNLRAGHFTASEAPAMLGLSKYKTRQQLLKEKATGISVEVNEATQRLFDAGHQAEADTRAWAEEFVGEELYPVTGSTEIDGLSLLASFDGLNMLETICWENKLWNDRLAESVTDGVVPDTHWPQLEQQLLVSGAEKVLFTVSDGERVEHVWYIGRPDRRAMLIAGWKQFAKDLTEYQHIAETPKAEGHTPDQLPALRIELVGQVSASNLDEFHGHALAVLDSIKTDLQTDDDFANAEKTVKWCGDVETRLDAAKQHALAQTESIDKLFRTIDSIKEETRQKRLMLEKLVKAQKESRKVEMVQSANAKYAEHVSALQAEIKGIQISQLLATPDFGGAIKGLKTISSMRDKLDTALANGKIEADQKAKDVRTKLEWCKANAEGYGHLFHDLQHLIGYDMDAFQAVIKNRIEEHQKVEAAKLEAERVRIEAEAKEKAEREAAAKLAEEEARIRAEERGKAQAEAEARRSAEIKAAEDQRAKPQVRESEPAPSRQDQVAKSQSSPPSRPSDDQIIEALSLHFRVHEMQVISWLLEMDLGSASARAAKEFA